MHRVTSCCGWTSSGRGCTGPASAPPACSTRSLRCGSTDRSAVSRPRLAGAYVLAAGVGFCSSTRAGQRYLRATVAGNVLHQNWSIYGLFKPLHRVYLREPEIVLRPGTPEVASSSPVAPACLRMPVAAGISGLGSSEPASSAEPGNGVGATFLSLRLPRRIEPQAVVASLPPRCDPVGLVDDLRGDPAVVERPRRRNPSVPSSDDDDAAQPLSPPLIFGSSSDGAPGSDSRRRPKCSMASCCSRPP